jgi:hypothetical protein
MQRSSTPFVAKLRKPSVGLDANHQQLRSASDNARKLGYYDQECEARLALGELEMKANPELGRSLLTQLAAEAHDHGMELIARKAMALGAGTNRTVVTAARSLPH